MKSSNSQLVSVIIPTYNRAAYIRDSVDSVLSQQLPPGWKMEVIVADDGSTDNTVELLRKYGRRIKLLTLPHQGNPSLVRNKAIAQAQGSLIAFQDSDDNWLPGKLKKQLPVFDDPAVSLCYGNAIIMDEDGKLSKKLLISPGKLKSGHIFKYLVGENIIPTLTVIVRREALEGVDLFQAKPKPYEDYELWLKLAARRGGKFVAINEPLARYRRHSGNYGTASVTEALSRIIGVFNYLWTMPYLQPSDREHLEKALFMMHENWSRQQNIEGNTPAISVVMGIYKDKAFVKDAVQSILDQTFKDFEFIIIDDGSQDGTYDVVAKFKDPRIRIIRQTNHGLVDVLNKGIRLARANLIARQDADDISLPRRFERELELISQNERLGVVSTFFKYVDEKTLKPAGVTIVAPTKSIDLARNLYFNNPVGHGTALIRKQAILEAGGYSSKYGPNEDYYLWHKIVETGWQIGVVPDVYYLYRLSSQGISRTQEEVQHRMFAKLVEEIWRGPIYSKPFWRIVSDNSYYKRLDSPYHGMICAEYKSHQIKLTFEFLLRGHLLNGYNNFIGALALHPFGALRLWPTLLWAPIKYMREFR